MKAGKKLAEGEPKATPPNPKGSGIGFEGKGKPRKKRNPTGPTWVGHGITRAAFLGGPVMGSAVSAEKGVPNPENFGSKKKNTTKN